MPIIKLTDDQIMVAAMVGVQRRIQYVNRKGKGCYGLDDDDANFNLKIEGALSEFALAKYLGIFWDGAGYVGGDDVGNEEVRTTSYATGSLIIRPNDKDHKRYWLLTGKDGVYDVKGYIFARDAKQKKYWTDKGNGRPPCYFVPQSDLIKAEPWDI